VTARPTSDDIVGRLVESLPEGVVVVDPARTENYRHDWTRYLAAGRPTAVVLAKTTGEHEVGRAKRDALPRQLGPDVMDLNQRVRRAIDPGGIMNPGVLW
jgi:glycolate oxidase